MVNLHPSAKKVLQVVALFTFLFALSFNVQTNVNGTVDVNIEQAEAQVSPICLVSSTLLQLKRPVRVCRCFARIGGMAVFQGFAVRCVATGPGCGEVKCLTSSAFCACI